MEIGSIISSKIGKNQDGDKNVILLEVEISEEDDTDTIELQCAPGEDYKPPIGSRVFIEKVSDAYDVAIEVDDRVEPDSTLKDGECEKYSIKDEKRAAKIRWKENGELILNDGTDYAILFNEMKIAFDKLKSEVATLTTAVNVHAALAVTPFIPNHGLPAPVVVPPPTADMSSSKVEKVRI